MSAEVAFLMSSILSDKTARYHEFAPGNPLELQDRPAAAKTGTTQSFSDNCIMNNVIGITGAGPIWHDVMEYVSNLYHFPADDFVRPTDVHAGSVSAYTGLLPHLGERTVTDWFIDGTIPTIQGSGSSYIGGPKCRPGNGKHCTGVSG